MKHWSALALLVGGYCAACGSDFSSGAGDSGGASSGIGGRPTDVGGSAGESGDTNHGDGGDAGSAGESGASSGDAGATSGGSSGAPSVAGAGGVAAGGGAAGVAPIAAGNGGTSGGCNTVTQLAMPVSSTYSDSDGPTPGYGNIIPGLYVQTAVWRYTTAAPPVQTAEIPKTVLIDVSNNVATLNLVIGSLGSSTWSLTMAQPASLAPTAFTVTCGGPLFTAATDLKPQFVYQAFPTSFLLGGLSNGKVVVVYVFTLREQP